MLGRGHKYEFAPIFSLSPLSRTESFTRKLSKMTQDNYTESARGSLTKQTSEDPAPNLAAAPPPSHPQSQSQVPEAGVVNPPTSVSSASPPQPHPTQSPARTLNINYENRHTSPILIVDAAHDNTTLFALNLQLHKPHMTISHASTSATIGTATFHALTTRIDTTAHDSPIALTAHGILRTSYTWSSPARGDVPKRWKGGSSSSELVCLTGNKVAVARVLFTCWSVKRCGSLEILGAEAKGGGFMDEVVVTGLALVESVLALRYTLLLLLQRVDFVGRSCGAVPAAGLNDSGTSIRSFFLESRDCCRECAWHDCVGKNRFFQCHLVSGLGDASRDL